MGYYLCNLGPLCFIRIQSQVLSSTIGHTKKVTVNAIFLIDNFVGNFDRPTNFDLQSSSYVLPSKSWCGCLRFCRARVLGCNLFFLLFGQ